MAFQALYSSKYIPVLYSKTYNNLNIFTHEYVNTV